MQIINSDGKTAITYPYTPNDIAAYIFIVIFGVATLSHIFYLFRFRAFYFTSFNIGCICVLNCACVSISDAGLTRAGEAFGYYGRSWSHRNQPNVKPYVMQYLLILPAPVFLAASIYVSLGRMVVALDAAEYTAIRPSRLAKLFVCLDIICFAVQIAGAGMESTTDASIGEAGGKVVTAGVILQLLFTVWFLMIAVQVQIRLQRRPTAPSLDGGANWRLYFGALYLSCSLIMLRNLVRAVQELQGFYGYVNSHEAFAYVFDAVPMSIVVWALVLFHPGRLVRKVKSGSEFVLPQNTRMAQNKDGGYAIYRNK